MVWSCCQERKVKWSKYSKQMQRKNAKAKKVQYDIYCKKPKEASLWENMWQMQRAAL